MSFCPGGIWKENSPDTLLDLATRFCLQNNHVFTKKSPWGSLKLQENLHLPVELCEQLLRICQQEGITVDDKFANIFSDFQNSRLKQLYLTNCPVTDIGMKWFLGHSLKKISLHNCSSLSRVTLESINQYSDNLVGLSIVNTSDPPVELCPQIFPMYLDTDHPDMEDEFTDEEEEREENKYEKRRYILRAPRLRSLAIRDLYVVQGRDYFNLLCKALPNLTHLDLSGVMYRGSQGMQSLKFLLNCPALLSLILHNVKEVKAALSTLTQLDRLEHLDISQSDDLYGDFLQPSMFLEELVKNLPRLKSLDISGTNLAAEYKDAGGRCDGRMCDIPGLARRIDRPLDFLGLYRTKEEACRREHIPAVNVTGNHNEAQLLLAGRRYLDRPMVMENLIDDLVRQVRMDTECDLRATLHITVTCMERHPREKKMQRHASALLYYLLPLLSNSNLGFTRVVRQRLLSVLLGVMGQYREDSVLMRNGCMVLWRFDTPQDLLAQYSAVVDILLYVGEYYSGDGESYIQRSAIFLLNSLVCQVDGEQKKVRGLSIIDGMLWVVKRKLQMSICDEVMEVAWSVMWNVTDETPENSQRFLDKSGMELFLQCKEAFPNTMDLLRNMMGLLGNIAEVKDCRRRLMSVSFVNEFSFLLDSSKDGIEVSYNAAGVLSHLASDGPSAWAIEEPSREHVLERLVRAVTRWDVNARRDINYRSLSPIIGLLSCDHTPECQLWASWALANLTQWEFAKYCPLVDREGGLTAIRNILIKEVDFSPNPVRDKLIILGKMAVRNIEIWRRADVHVDVMVRD